MSYTVILDHAEERRQYENRINAVLRHCRIGKVVQKPRKSAEQFKGIEVRPTGWPGPPDPAIHPYFFKHGLGLR